MPHLDEIYLCSFPHRTEIPWISLDSHTLRAVYQVRHDLFRTNDFARREQQLVLILVSSATTNILARVFRWTFEKLASQTMPISPIIGLWVHYLDEILSQEAFSWCYGSQRPSKPAQRLQILPLRSAAQCSLFRYASSPTLHTCDFLIGKECQGQQNIRSRRYYLNHTLENQLSHWKYLAQRTSLTHFLLYRIFLFYYILPNSLPACCTTRHWNEADKQNSRPVFQQYNSTRVASKWHFGETFEEYSQTRLSSLERFYARDITSTPALGTVGRPLYRQAA